MSSSIKILIKYKENVLTHHKKTENSKTSFKRTSLSSLGAKQPGLPSAFVVVGCFAPDEERLVLLKLVVQFSFFLWCVKMFRIYLVVL